MIRVWTYWEGPKPAYIDVCLRSMARACDVPGVSFHQLSPANLGRFLKPKMLNLNYRRMTAIGVKVSAIRAALLAHYGGWWWDADTIALRSPLKLMERHPSADMLCMTWTRLPLRYLNGYIYAKARRPVAREWLARVNAKLKCEPCRAIKWLELGEKILTPLLKDRDDCAEINRQLFLPIDIDSNVAEFFRQGDPLRYVRDDAVCYGLNHSWFWYHKRREMSLPPVEWERSELLIHRLLHFARKELLK